MAMSHDVELPRDRAPVFPDRCVICHRDRPRGSVSIRESEKSGWVLLHLLTVFAPRGKKETITAPACEPCGRSLKRWRLVRHIFEGAVVVAALLIGRMVLEWNYWASLGLVVGVVIAMALIEVLWAPPFGATVSGDSVSYEFAREDLAKLFADLNEAEVAVD